MPDTIAPTIESLTEKVKLLEDAITEVNGRFFDYFGMTQQAIMITNGLLHRTSDTLKVCARTKLAQECANQIALNDSAIAAPMPDAPAHWLRGLRIAVFEAGKTFRNYEQLHLAKDTDEGRAKAMANANMAALCENAIGAVPPLWKPKSMGGGC